MEAVESSGKTLLGDKLTTPEAAKSVDRHSKNLKEAAKVGPFSDSMENFQENGIRVSLNGELCAGGNVVDGGKLVDNRISGALEDSEMNGVSSLLKMKASAREVGVHGRKGDPANGFVSLLGVVGRNDQLEAGSAMSSAGIRTGNGVPLVININGELKKIDGKEVIVSANWLKNFDASKSPPVANAGLKKVLTPGGEIGLLEAEEVLTKLKFIAEDVSRSSLVDCVVIKGWLSAFYQLKGSELPVYPEPQRIPGLEDWTEALIVDMTNYKNSIETPVGGPVEEDWLSSQPGRMFNQHKLEGCPDVLDDRVPQMRKQKSVAEILKADTLDKAGSGKDVAQKQRDLGELALSSSAFRRGKRKHGDDSESDGNSNSDSVQKRRKRTKLTGSLKASKEKGFDCGTDGNGTREEKERGSKNARKDESINDCGNLEEQQISSFSVSTRRKRVINGGPSDVGDANESGEQVEGASLSRGRKKGKYLSPPFKSSIARQKKLGIEAEALVVSPVAQLREQKTQTAHHLVGSRLIMKHNETAEEKLPTELGADHEAFHGPFYQTPIEFQSTKIDLTEVNTPAAEILACVRSVALCPQHLREKNSLDAVGKFLSVFRNLVYSNGSDSTVCMNTTSQESERALSGTEQNSMDHNSSKRDILSKSIDKNDNKRSDRPKAKKAAKTTEGQTKEGTMPKKTKIKQAARALQKRNDKESDQEASPAALFVSFGLGSSLPPKDDLIKIFGKYGALNIQYTDTFYNNYCSRVVFMRSSEAENAFNHVQLISPFGSTKVTFQLRYLSASADLRELREIPSAKPSSSANERVRFQKKSSPPQGPAIDSSPLNYIRNKLEMLNSMLETSDARTTEEMKARLQGEIKGLLEKVSTMIGS